MVCLRKNGRAFMDQVLEVNGKFKYETDSLKKEGVSPFP
jgi:hypothetical protein